ncbi:trans-aconitate 2-methyltransferase [Streptomyces sp. MNU89]|uniref:class I SAM-dependent methyltransferase n=1 Tax=Streptomyces sp. MNU89 TaxID=2560025 RepID=UPI001E64F46A|nr:class I SAM-dependent methyltransferase [Streptomyces sp. MNU89]MCC9742998.1 class I SAM-dependent methyltransferase [Streptomyces sp. MNU89]
MVDRLFSDERLARLYDRLCAGREDFGFYLPLVLSAESVLDVGCGTGELLRRARGAGHTGRLCGLDPAEEMLGRAARHRTDIEWVLGDLAAVGWDREFDLVVMTGHAFQVLVTDDDVRTALAAMRSALTEGGRLVFETRNPSAREWERWTPEHVVEAADDTGAVVRLRSEAETPVEGGLVSFTQTFTSPAWDGPRVSRSTLRFLDAPALEDLLTDAGLAITEQYGDWSGGPLTESSPEIITVAARACAPGRSGASARAVRRRGRV